ncbi:hypothetical protein [Bradyrhizobium iriomotense]|uniref:GlsB/YeaQ/YmgE family stress response membrane protein n=1 Tax=Bradyrhizobium iriomotense TaxID=441950 RepID=A0ABQ6AVL2_9BRAD|nr:hypothetical protein [Bradyrhizobium iriomotense]GLR85276.1 hypothetical protein GCM10007857_19860 [Bradyrhizobium iriomotense]
MTTGVMIGYGLAVVVFIALLVAAFKIEDGEKGKAWFNIVFVLGGGLSGWTAGLLAIPFPDLPQKLTDLGALSTALVGGVIGTKLIDALTKKIESGLDRAFIGTSALFLTAFLLGGLSTVIWRLSKIS